MYARGVNVNLTPLTSKRGALATDARGCSLWRYLLERPPPVWESRVRDPLGTIYEFGLCGPGRGCYIYIYIYIWTPFCLQNCLNSSWHRFNKVLETFIRDFGPYWHDIITLFLKICRLHIHDENLPFHHITKVLYWIEIWWLWRPFE